MTRDARGDLIDEVDEKGNRIVGDTLLLLINAHHETIPFTLPPIPLECSWELNVDTSESEFQPRFLRKGIRFDLKGRSTALFRVLRTAEALDLKTS